MLNVCDNVAVILDVLLNLLPMNSEQRKPYGEREDDYLRQLEAVQSFIDTAVTWKDDDTKLLLTEYLRGSCS